MRFPCSPQLVPQLSILCMGLAPVGCSQHHDCTTVGQPDACAVEAEGANGSSGSPDSTTDGPADDSTGGAPPPNGSMAASRAVDLLFIIDNSWSMASHQAQAVRAVDALLEPLIARNVDIRMGVTTTDVGNPWCTLTAPPGRLSALSCRERLGDFETTTEPPIDARASACTELCQYDWLGSRDPWLEFDGGSNIDFNVDFVDAAKCVLPQGINGCGFEQPLRAIQIAMHEPEEPRFARADALLAVILITDEVDCSYQRGQETIFHPDDDKVFWSDPKDVATSAICWNAGVRCEGDECWSEHYDAVGSVVGPAAAVMQPIRETIDALASRPAVYMAAITGVGSDGTVTYDHPADDEALYTFGTGPGCTTIDGETALPPVRIREVVDAVGGDLLSICASNQKGNFEHIAMQILRRLPSK